MSVKKELKVLHYLHHFKSLNLCASRKTLYVVSRRSRNSIQSNHDREQIVYKYEHLIFPFFASLSETASTLCQQFSMVTLDVKFYLNIKPQKMARLKKYAKFLSHLIYVFSLSYFISLQSYKVVHLKRVARYITDIKYILLWTDFYGLEGEGQNFFIKKKCPYTNCYVTNNRSLLGDVRLFDVIIFNSKDVSESDNDLPWGRALNQKYIFAGNDSCDNVPVCSTSYDDFFNWTWTYRDDSTIIIKPFSIYSSNYIEIGHKYQWIRNMLPIKPYFRSQLSGKHKAAAIFLDKCESRSKREDFIRNLQKHLRIYKLNVDVFGNCSNKKCDRNTMSACYYRLKKDYFFYLALEDSFARDYVTDVVLNAYQNDVVPIVFGGASYEKLLPPTSFINALQYTEEELAKKMYQIISTRELYYKFFEWKNHYIIKEAERDDACTLCMMLNKPKLLLNRVSYVQFRSWWNPSYVRRCNLRSRLFGL